MGCAQLRMFTPRKKLVCLTEWVMRPSCSRATFSSARAIGSCPGVHRAQSQALDERRHACLCLRVVAGDEHVQWATLGWAGRQNMGKQGVERLDDMRAGGGRLGNLLRAGTAVGGDEAREIGGDGVGDVDDDLAVQGVPVLANHRRRAGVRHGDDNDVPRRGGAGRPDSGAAERGGQFLGLAGSRPMIRLRCRR